MSTNNGFKNFFIEGFVMLIAPGKVRDVTIYFKQAGGLVNIRGVDIWNKDKTHLGYAFSQQIDLETLRSMRNYIRAHRNRWQRVYNRAE